jgi:DNA-binding SARP family transcriptional activator/Tfp pilus assembly protein PilF
MEKAIHFEILGPIRVRAEDREIAVTGRERTLLAMLLLRANQPVETARLVDAIWGEVPPRDARNQLQGCVSRLRKQLASAGVASTILTDPAGYRIDLDENAVDLQRFHHWLAEARTAAEKGRHREARNCYRTALALWRGPALAGVDSSTVRKAATALDEERLRALDERIEIELKLGAAGELAPELTDLVAQHPYRESLHGALMLALYRDGRQADALATYQRIRELLVDEVGTEPGVKLRELHQAILRNELTAVEPVADSKRASPVTDGVVTPRELPADVAGFTGRTAYLDQLDELLANGDATTVVITAIDGMAGIGKTALAVHAAHRFADRYPEGQLFIDLHGYSQGIAPIDPVEALDRLLRSMGVPGEQIPQHLDERAGLYRSRLANRRVLILLDNAVADAQVSPLLPGSPGCLVLVTSRRRLTSLDATHTVSLDMLPAADAVELFTRTTGRHRLTNQPPQRLAETVELCSRLPLAIRIAAARLKSHPSWSLPDLIHRLLDQNQRLAELADGSRSVTAALDLSYQHLTANQQRVYRLLGLHPGPDIESYMAAALADTTIAQAERLLDQLHQAHLLQEPTVGRYLFHDLIRTHAAQAAARDEGEPDRRAALTRLLDHHCHTVVMAMDAAHPYERERQPRVPPVSTTTPPMADPSQATNWLDTELPNVLATARHAAHHGWPVHAQHLAASLQRHLQVGGRYVDAAALHQRALEIARTAGDRTGELRPLIGLGHIHRGQARYQKAIDDFGQALDVARATGDRIGELDALYGLGRVFRAHGKYERAIDHYGQALEIARATGDRLGEQAALDGLGHVLVEQDKYEQALTHLGQALEIARATGDHNGELNALIGLCEGSRKQGRHDHAATYGGEALEIARATGNRIGELSVLHCLGDVHRLRGRLKQADDHFTRALELARATGHRSGELNARRGLGDVRRLQQRYEEAAAHYQHTLGIAREISNPGWEFEGLQGLGRLSQATDHPETALTHHRQALDLAAELQLPADQARAHDGLAHAYHILGQPEQARRHWQRALAILTTLGIDHTEDTEATTSAIRAHLDQR